MPVTIGLSPYTVLQLQEIQLMMGPRATTNDTYNAEIEKRQRSYRAFFQKPELRDMIVKDYIQGREIGISARASYPVGISIDINRKLNSVVSRPSASAGIDLKALNISCRERNQFYWRYRIQPKADPLPQSPLDRFASFSNHQGRFSYSSESLPKSIRIEIAAVCGIPPVSITSKIASLLTPIFIRDKEINYPCRNVRLKLRVDILPSERDIFVFPRAGFTAKNIDLGGYKFFTEGEQLILAISREATQQLLPSPHSFTKELQRKNWRVRADQPGDLKIQKTGGDQQVAVTEGELHLPVKSLQKKKK